MLGYVLVFRPTTGAGTVVTETGQAYPFASRDGKTDFHGGDLVEFQVGPDELPAPSIDQLELVQKGAEVRVPTSRVDPLDVRLQLGGRRELRSHQGKERRLVVIQHALSASASSRVDFG